MKTPLQVGKLLSTRLQINEAWLRGFLYRGGESLTQEAYHPGEGIYRTHLTWSGNILLEQTYLLFLSTPQTRLGGSELPLAGDGCSYFEERIQPLPGCTGS
jgi:hypothetical protein